MEKIPLFFKHISSIVIVFAGAYVGGIALDDSYPSDLRLGCGLLVAGLIYRELYNVSQKEKKE